jgi:beta-glucosidase
VDALLAKMTVEEKVRQLYHPDGMRFTDAQNLYGNTSFGGLSVNNDPDVATPAADVANRNAFQSFMINNSRLNIPVFLSNEGLHSGAKGGTVFPELVTLGSSWNVTLASSIGQVIALAGRAIGADLLFAPVINLWTDERYGRLQEAPSSNPTLTYHIGAAYTSGLQGDNGSGPFTYLDSDHVAALGKHLAAYGAALGGLNAAPAEISNRTLHDLYMKPWRGFAKAGGRGTMPSHNTIFDVPSHANSWLVNTQYRQTLGFGDGVTVSDCNDIGALEDYGMATNGMERAALALAGGVDMDLMCGGESTAWSYNNLQDALAQGLVTEAQIDTSVRRVLGHKFAAGLFDDPMTDPSRVAGLNTAEHQKLAREAAQQGSVVLINKNGVLPLATTGIKSVAVIGPNGGCAGQPGTGTGPPTDSCEARSNVLGSYTQISSHVNVSTVHEALTQSAWAAAGGVSVTYSPGAAIDTDDTTMIDAAVQAAQAADVAVVVVGDSLKSCGEWADRDDLDLPGSQLQLLAALSSSVTTPIVVVLIHGRPATFGPDNILLSNVSALVSTFRPGQLGAQGIVDILAGAVNPSGRLGQNWPRYVGQVNSGGSPWLQHIRGKWLANGRGETVDPDGRRYDPYVDGPATPLFHFGDGLSYTTYEIAGNATVAVDSAVVSQAKVSAEGAIGSQTILTATVQVANTGAMDGQVVVQVFGQDPPRMGIVRHWKRLWGFARVDVAAGKTVTAKIPVIVDNVAFHDVNMDYKVAPGAYTLRVGLSSVTDTATTPFTL